MMLNVRSVRVCSDRLVSWKGKRWYNDNIIWIVHEQPLTGDWSSLMFYYENVQERNMMLLLGLPQVNRNQFPYRMG